ncbi:MAG: lysozyme [Lactobacillales bacterium]|nr:lysozyme [Lactobacillales bacterium]
MSDLIKKYEGFSPTAYQCPAGVWTIGYGTTVYPDGRRVQSGDMVSKQEAEAFLNDYLIRSVDPYIGRIDCTLTYSQREALASLIYNWNGPAFLKSKLYRAICDRDFSAVYREWDFGIKNNLKGVIKRRAEELFLFMKDI